MRQCDHKQLAKQSNRIYGAGGMRLKHAAHVCDFGRVEAQWLVEIRRILPKIRRISKKRAARTRNATYLARARLKHCAHVCDAGCVESQRLIERQRALPSQKGVLAGGIVCLFEQGIGQVRKRAWGKSTSSEQRGEI